MRRERRFNKDRMNIKKVLYISGWNNITFNNCIFCSINIKHGKTKQ